MGAINTKPFIQLLFLSLLLSCQNDNKGGLQVGAIPDKIDFNLHVRPILSDRCYSCHGPDKNSRKGDLRLDTREGLFEANQERGQLPPVTPKNLKKSELYHRIISHDPDYQMPTPESNLSISVDEIAILEKWIEDGAEWKPHWAFIPPEKPNLPKTRQKDWPQNEIDHFILAKLEQAGISPSEPADKATLLRRLSLDLTGLPPSLEEIDAFLTDSSEDAYEKAVDRLLDSPHYGENMTVEWLDLSRYADTHGYQADYYRPHWYWRDWVIKAFNGNMPFDEFVTWQLAGDLMPNASKEQILATGFNRNHAQNAEGGIVEEEYRVEYVADRTQTLGTAFLGLTLQCARCHDHKYDPISQKEFYQLFAFFNNVAESGQITWHMPDLPGPTLLLPDEEVEAQLTFIEQLGQQQEKELETIKESQKEDFQRWLKSFNPVLPKKTKGMIAHFSLDKVRNEKVPNLVVNGKTGQIIDPLNGKLPDEAPNQVKGIKGNGLKLKGDVALSFPGLGRFGRSTPFSIGLWVKIPADLEKGVIFHSNKGSALYTYKGYQVSVENGRFDVRLAHDFPSNSIHLLSEQEVPREKWVHITLAYDGSSKANGTNFYLDGNLLKMKINRDHLTRDIVFHPQNPGDKPPVNTHLKVGARWRGKGFTNGSVDEIMVFDRALTAIEVNQLAGGSTWKELKSKSSEQLLATEKQLLWDYYLANHSPAFQKELEELEGIRKEYATTIDRIPHAMVIAEMQTPRPTFVLERGAYDEHGEEVEPGTPEMVKAFSKEFVPNRLGMAEWLFAPDNPLPARVTVNRFWQHYFGQGIVSTTEDFGSQGALPTHPLLLDWLALEFMESGWDVKHMQKLIVMSATYRQSSKADSVMLEMDFENKLLARGPKSRLSAEDLRDLVLSASGLLVKKIGGPSVKPYQPEGLWGFNQMSGRYQQDEGEGLYRRSLYTFWKRTIPPPSMNIFDAPTRAYCVVKREKTATPLQALVLLNDPQFLEASRVMAQMLTQKEELTAEERIVQASRLLTGNSPSVKQKQLLLTQYKEAESLFAQKPQKIQDLLSVGEYPNDPSVDQTKLAALMTVVTTIMNFEATIRKS